ncbi:hypothetical protein BJ742DRAFT_850600 [Cladochytrium replicatum]|nr:hypothetical protein BJ742DRAFT_850600 [Cladochytrium replicatum]
MVEEFEKAEKVEYAIMFHEVMAIAGWTSNRTLYALFKMFLGHKDVHAAVVCYTELKAAGFKFNLKQYTSALSACSQTGNTEVALELWKRMREDEIVPDSIAYHTMFTTLLNGNGVETAVKLYNLLEAFENPGNNSSNEATELQSNASPFLSTCAQHLLREGNVRELAAHISKLGPLGIAPDEATISTLVSHHTKRGDVITALTLASVLSRHATVSQYRGSHPRMAVDCAILRAAFHWKPDNRSFGIYIKSTLLRAIPKDDAVHEGYGVGRQVSDVRIARDPEAVKVAVSRVKSTWQMLADDGLAMEKLTWQNTLALLSATASFQDAAELVIDGLRVSGCAAVGLETREFEEMGVGASARPVVDARAVEILVGRIGRYREFGAGMLLTTQLRALKKELLQVKVKTKASPFDEEDFRVCEKMMRDTVGGLSKFLDAWRS